MSWKITVGGKEVQSPANRVLATIFIVVSVIVAILAALILSPILIPLHFILLAAGRKGFATKTVDGKLSIHIDEKSFRAAA